MIRWPYSWRKPEGIHVGIPKVGGIWYRWDCLMENLFIHLVPLPEYGIYRGEKRIERVIVSLTSFPKRINQAYYAIKSLMIQSYRADEIVLWLAEDQFPNRRLPACYEKLIERGLTVRWCSDFKSHKKYFWALQNQKENELVLTYDDDIIYEYDSIEQLVKLHEQFPGCIICNRGHEITISENGDLEDYKCWKIYSGEGVLKPSIRIMPSTGAGCLYPFKCMPSIAFDWECISQNALLADDIWMKFCSLYNHIFVMKTRQRNATLCNVFGSQKEKLTVINDLCGNNIRVIECLLKVFPDNIHNLKNDVWPEEKINSYEDD